MRAHGWRMVGLAGALAAAGCLPGPEDFDTRVSEICVHTLVPFAGGAGQGVSTEVSLADAVRDLDELGSGAAITLASLSLAPGPGIADFSFVQRVEIDLAATDEPPLRLLEAADVAGSDSVDAPGAPGANLRVYLDGAAPSLQVTFLGQVPATPWSVTLDACLAVHDAAPAAPR
jgi:hypothetical protein